MKITCMNMYEFSGFEKIADYISETLIIELDSLTKKEEIFLNKNNILYRKNKGKIEIIILSFRNYFVEYNSKAEIGIYFKKTEEYYNYYEECYYVDEMSDNEPNLVICREGLKIEIIIMLGEKIIKKNKNRYNEYFKKSNFKLIEYNQEGEFRESFKRVKFKNIYIGKVIYNKNNLIVKYRHKDYEKKLIFKNIKNARTKLYTFPYYETLLDKMDHDKISEKIGFYKMINRASKYNELYIIDYHYNRVIIKFND